jgi:5-methylthioadenosine/S-adenosylhomocysteine deaminase
VHAEIRWGLGTDSAVSVDTLDLVTEAQLARAMSGMSAEDALRRITVEAARALQWEAEIGSLEPGKWADMCVLEVDSPSPVPEVLADCVLRRGGDAMMATYVEGREVWSRGNGTLGAGA